MTQEVVDIHRCTARRKYWETIPNSPNNEEIAVQGCFFFFVGIIRTICFDNELYWIVFCFIL